MKRSTATHSQRGGIFINLIILLMFALLCATVYLARHPLMRFFGEWWVIQDPLVHSDAILVLSDDNFYGDRASRAAELFRQGQANLVVASGRRLRPGAGIAELIEHDLVERGVPKENVLRLPHDADNTREEAEALAHLAQSKNWRSVIIVTSNYHTRRSRYIFERVFPPNISIRIASAHDADFDPDHWWEKRKSIKELAREITGMLVAMWELKENPHSQTQPQSMVSPPSTRLLYGIAV